MTRRIAAFAAGGALLLGAVLFVAAERRAAVAPHYAGTPIDPPKAVADFVLVDTGGRPAHLLDERAALTFLFFGYTRCPDECPLALASLGRAYRTLTPAQRASTRVVLVTVDPVHDTPNALARYVAHFDQHIVALGGSREVLQRVWASYGVEVQPEAHELIGHGGAIYAIDASAHAVLIYPPNATPAELAADVAKLEP